MMVMFFVFWRHVDLSVDASVSEKHTLSIFRAEVAMLGSGGIYIGLEGGLRELANRHFSPEDRGSVLLRNVGIYRRVYTAPKPRLSSSLSLSSA
jgi:hypothetical protein